MINHLLNEPYLTQIDPLNLKKGMVKDLTRFDLTQILLGQKKFWTYKFKEELIESDEKFFEILQNFDLNQVEFDLLEHIYCLELHLSPDLLKEYSDLSFMEKVELFNLSGYETDRNLNDLIFYIYLMMEVAGFLE